MRPVIPLEFLGEQKLDFDLYDEAGNIVYKSGEALTSGKLLMLTQRKIFKSQDNILQDINSPIPQKQPDNVEFKSAFSPTATKVIVINTRKIVKDALEGKMPSVELCKQTMEVIVDEVTEKMEEIECIGQLRVYDEYTFSHTINVASMSAVLGKYIKMSDDEIRELTLSALLHDIGKMRVPLEILNKPGKYTPEEFKVMKDHTVLGYEFLTKEIGLPENYAICSLQHQEKYGGAGYPYGLKGEEISKFAQITAIVDVYDALVSTRVYKKAILSHDAIKIMISDGGKAFNPSLLYKFIYLANYKNSKDLVIVDKE